MRLVRELLEDFATDRRGEGKRPGGVKAYIKRLKAFDAWLDGVPVENLSWMLIADYRNELAGRCAIPTVETMMVTIRAFCRWATDHGYLAEDVSARVKVPRRRPALPKPLSATELAALWRVLTDDESLDDRERWIIRRNRLAVSLMYYAGLRRSEVARLRWGTVSLRNRTLTVHDSKSGDRAIPIHPELLLELANWPAGRRTDPVVLSWRGGAMTPGGIGHIFEIWLPERGVVISAHRLRHSFATEYLRATRDIRGLMDLLGHRSLETTQIYTQVVADEHRANIGRVPSLSTF